MDFIVDLGNYVTNVVLIVASGVATIMMLVVGYLWMFSGGDPRKVAMAKSAGMMVFIGMVIAGCAYMIPRIVNEQIVLPSGGRLQGVYSLVSPQSRYYEHCDEALRTRLERWEGPANHRQIHSLVEVMKTTVNGCEPERWQVEVSGSAVISGAHGWKGASYNACFYSTTTVGSPKINYYVRDAASQDDGRVSEDMKYSITSNPRWSQKTAGGDVLVLFYGFYHFNNGSGQGLPDNNASCWFFSSEEDRWYLGKPLPVNS